MVQLRIYYYDMFIVYMHSDHNIPAILYILTKYRNVLDLFTVAHIAVVLEHTDIF
jgi:hypothetical protein